MGSMGLWYCWQTYTGSIQPTLATWIIFSVATTLSLWTYWSSEQHNLISNILNTVDTFSVNAILLVIVLFGVNVRFGINRFELGCLVACGVILVIWRFTKKHAASNLTLQTVMTVAYLPTINQLWNATTNTESFVVWAVWFVGCSLALVTARLSKDKLAVVYAARALLMVSIIIVLMIRIALK